MAERPLTALKRELRADRIEPTWSKGVPFCSEDCPRFDGKRCDAMGFRPDGICEPSVEAMGKALS